MATDNEEVEIDLDHPWVEASLHGGPRPTNVQFGLQPVEVAGEPVGFMTVMSPVGVFNFFVPKEQLKELYHAAGNMLMMFDRENQSSLVVATKADEKEAVSLMQAAKEMRNG